MPKKPSNPMFRRRAFALGLLVVTLAACEKNAPANDLPANGAAEKGGAREVTSAKERLAASPTRSLPAGTRIEVVMTDALSSRTNKPDETVRTTVSGNILDGAGRIAIPAGSVVLLRIVQLEPGSAQVRPEGRLALAAQSITTFDQSYPLDASLGDIPHTFVGRGITTDEAARVGAGTAIGAAVGQAIGKDTRSTTIGGAVGAIAGTAVAVRYAYRDVVVPAGSVIVLTLAQKLDVSAR